MRKTSLLAVVAVATLTCSALHSFQIHTSLAATTTTAFASTDDYHVHAHVDDGHVFHTRHLLFTLVNCSPAAIDEFPRDLFTHEQRLEGALVLHFLGAIYMFLALALVCDEYFIPSLDIICWKLNLQDDVAGATFMAGGSSAPDLATTLIGVFIAKNDVGLGAIVGSAVFNVLLVPAVCALAAGMAIYLNWWPILRDSIYYAFSVAVLSLVIFDGYVFWYEALCILLVYVLYIIFMKYNRVIERWVLQRCSCFRYVKWLEPHGSTRALQNFDLDAQEVTVECDASSDVQTMSMTTRHHAVNKTKSLSTQSLVSDWPMEADAIKTEVDGPVGVDTFSTPIAIIATTNSDAPLEQPTMAIIEPEPVVVKVPVNATRTFTLPKGSFLRFLYFVGLPLRTVLFATVPDCQVPRFKKLFWLTFIMATAWIAAFAYVMVWMIVVIGATLNIADSLMGVTFVAFGASLSDLINSYLVVKEGKGDMAICNALGSNVFDILVCLGLPWLLRTLINDDARVNGIPVYSQGLLYSTLTLLLTVIFFLAVNMLNHWKLNKKYGLALLVFYFLFITFASLYELNIFGYVNPPDCRASNWV